MSFKIKFMSASVLAFALAGTASAAVLSVTQNANIAAGIAAFGPSTVVLDWDVAGAPGSASGNLAFGNWINGTGFAGGDLAINGVENVTWNFAAPVTKIGFAIATGLGILPSEVDHLGAIFNLTASNGDTAVLTLVDGGNGYSAWVEISSATPFSSLSFAEVGSNIQDQYWGDVSVQAAVPEPASWALMIGGLAVAGMAMRRRKAAISFA